MRLRIMEFTIKSFSGAIDRKTKIGSDGIDLQNPFIICKTILIKNSK